MESQLIVHYINDYGYFIIFLFLFCGIVGIPAPEESLLFLIGVLLAHHQLKFGYAAISSVAGAFFGMNIAFTVGRLIGQSFILKFGKYVGITTDRWESAKKKYEKNVNKTILFGYYLPGIRQISPYFAGITGVPFLSFFLIALVGAVLWALPFIILGYYLGTAFQINPSYVPYLGIILLVVFFAYVLVKRVITKSKSRG